MALIQFTKNYTDHSNDTGFQFEFHCDKCGSGHRSTFQANKLGMATGFMRAAASLFGGGSLWNAANAGNYMKDALRGKAWDDAFAAAIAEAKPRFRQCTRCGQWVCPDVCWNEGRSLCESCAPNLQEEAAAIQAQVAVEQAREKMQKVDQVADLDVKEQKVAQCPHCQARVAGAGKFCPECGKPLAAAKVACGACGAKIAATAKFCPECGEARAK